LVKDTGTLEVGISEGRALWISQVDKAQRVLADGIPLPAKPASELLADLWAPLAKVQCRATLQAMCMVCKKATRMMTKKA
jgi:hypothetical protein